MKFISGTHYAYYILHNINKNKYYYGIVDIELNKVLYNIEENFTTFIPIQNNEMLAISDSSAYKLCIINVGDSCDGTCSSEYIALDPSGNKCQTDCDSGKIKLMPEGICIGANECDTNVYILNEAGTECGLCNYFYPEGDKYKLINSAGCLSNIPNNAEYYNEHLFLLKCKTNYHLDNNECVPDFCYERCETCSEISNNIDDQKCLTCKDNYVLNNGNCDIFIPSTNPLFQSSNLIIPSTSSLIPSNILLNSTTLDIIKTTILDYILCPKGSYISLNNNCLNCSNICKDYQLNNCNCTSCNYGNYLDKNTKKCYKCENVCENYELNTCQCINEYYYFYGYYKGTNESIEILKTNNLTNIENIILDVIRTKLENSEINSMYINNGNYFYVESPNNKFIVSNLDNQEEITTSIELGECEDKLKENKTLSENDSLYILYIEVSEEGIHAPRTEYEVYYKSENNSFENMDLGICKDMKINKSVSINISESDIDKYNSSSGYYNDICYTSTTESGTDITLTDRRNEYIDNNMAVCEADCEFTAYDTNRGKAICSCPIALEVSHIDGNKIDKEKLKSNFINIKNIANINLLKCYQLLFSNKIFKNIGCIIISVIIILGLIGVFLFYFLGYNLLKQKINSIISSTLLEKNNNKEINKGSNDKEYNINKKEDIDIYRKNKEKNDNSELNIKNKEIKSDKKKKKKKRRKNSSKNKNNVNQAPPKKSSELNIKETNKINIKENINNNKQLDSLEHFNIEKEKDKKEIIEEKIKQIINNYNDTEMNLLPYEEAIELDKRNYLEYYLSLIKTRHLLIFSFCYNRDYNSRIIKIILFFFTFSVNYTVNALFFNDDTMHKIYEDEGKFNFVYQIPQILYSSTISIVLIMIVKMLALTEKNILNIKNAKIIDLDKIYKSESKCINYKFIMFFIFIFVFLLLFWYYVGCFCAVYKNTQIHLLSDTLISFVSSMLYPFLLYLLPGIFRIPALKNEEKKGEYMYNFSKIIQLFV